jgi:hypothetical protein
MCKPQTKIDPRLTRALIGSAILLVFCGAWLWFYVVPHDRVLTRALDCSAGSRTKWERCYRGAIRNEGGLLAYINGQ